jgi:hypothetical protein
MVLVVSDDARTRILWALSTGHPADEECRRELLAGATFELPARTALTADLVVIYRRRVHHLRWRHIRFVGDDVAERLAASGQKNLRIASVSGHDNFAVFLAADSDQVIDIIGVDGSVAGARREGSSSGVRAVAL